MPAPSAATYSVAARVAAHTALRDLIDSGSGPGKIRVRDSADVLLAELLLTDPCGSVNATTGQLTLTMAGSGTPALANGTASYAEVCNSADVAHLALPAAASSSPVAGSITFNTLSIVGGTPIDVLAATIG